jgi:hypothetical protein
LPQLFPGKALPDQLPDGGCVSGAFQMNVEFDFGYRLEPITQSVEMGVLV